MADLGLLGGLASGIERGLQGYGAARKSLAEEALMKRQQALAEANAIDILGSEEYAKRFGAPQQEAPAEGLVEQPAAGMIPGGILPKGQREGMKWEAEGMAAKPGFERVYDPATKSYKAVPRQLTPEEKIKREQEGYDTRIKAAAAKKSEKESGAKQLSATDVLKVQEGATIPSLISDFHQLIDEQKDSFGPITGRARASNPYDTEAQDLSSKFTSASQSFGRYMEGGVLRKEDEVKYAKMFPNLADTPDVAKRKLSNVQEMLNKKLTQDVSALKQSGYDTSGIQIPKAGSVTEKAATKVVDGVTYRKVEGGWEAAE